MMARCLHNLSALVASLVLASWTCAQDLGVSAPAQQRPVALTNAIVHTISGETYAPGYVSFENGVIVEAGPGDKIFGRDTDVLDLEGRHVWPGLIAPVTELGLTEVASVRQTRDFDEVGRFTPEARAATAVNPDSTLIPVTRSNGILTFVAFPSNGAVPGTASIMRAEGWTWEDMALREDAGVIVNWPSMHPSQDWWADEPDAEQRERIRTRIGEIDTFFREAQSYLGGENPETSIRFEALRPVLPGPDGAPPERPVFIFANELDQITASVVWATGLGLRPVIIGGHDAPLCADLLLQHDVPIIIEGTQRFPKRDDSPHDEAYTLPSRLTELGVRWCLASSDRTGHERNLPYNASKAIAFGLPMELGVRGVTLSTAEILEVDAALGSIEPGKAATLIVTDGHILEHATRVEQAFVDGRKIDLANKQTALAEKYVEKYEQMGLLDPEARDGGD
ncbi:MAG: hypothetical protein AAGB48_09795 [Planctomycetota bacterium]